MAILSGGLSLDEAESHLESMTYSTRCDSEIAPLESSRRPMHFTLRDSKGARRPIVSGGRGPGEGLAYDGQVRADRRRSGRR
jgi:hypothetical protein